MGTHLPTNPLNHILQYTPFDHRRLLPLPFMYNPVLSVVRIDAKPLATKLHRFASIMEVFQLRIQSVYSLFLQYTPNY